MTGLDTNVVVRLIARDDAAQVARAARLIRAQSCWLPTTVLLETEWVLRAAYGYLPEQIAQAFEMLASMHNVTLENAGTVRTAIAWHRGGMGFADALHLAGSREHERFASFDSRLHKVSARLATRPTVVEP